MMHTPILFLYHLNIYNSLYSTTVKTYSKHILMPTIYIKLTYNYTLHIYLLKRKSVWSQVLLGKNLHTKGCEWESVLSASVFNST